MMRLQLFSFFMVSQLALSSAWAQVPDEPADARDVPSRAARLSFMEGSVAFQAAGSDAWGDGTLNRPVTVNDRIWSDADSRAEIHLGSSAIRLSGRTSVHVTRLDQRTLQVSVGEGTVEIHVRDLPRGALMEVDTPTAAVSLHRVGAYRIDVDAAGTSARVVVRRGAAEVSAEGGAFELAAHSRATVAEAAGNASPALGPEPDADAFDTWCDGRDAREDNPPALHYVSRDTVGYEDLDGYGAWQQTPEYGPVWLPQDTDPQWAPYQDGRWSWVDPWGWTWIDAAPWGYAPFHYGRWISWGGRWGWAPGPIVDYPTYAPALVGFIGAYGPGWSGYRDPLVGWFPLGWNEAYVPSYRASYNYLRRVNTSFDIRNVDLRHIHQTQVYLNRGIPGAVTTVPRNVMQGARPTAGQRVSVPAPTLAQAAVTGFTASVSPRMISVVGAHNAHAQPPAEAVQRPVMSRLPPAAAPVPFARREPALQHNDPAPVPGPAHAGPARPTAPTTFSHPVAPVPHTAAPSVIGPHPAPPWYGPRVHNVGQPPHVQEPGVYRVPQPPRYEGPVYNSAPRNTAPVPHYNAPGAPLRAPAPRFAPPVPHIAPHPQMAVPRIGPAIHPGGRR